jgi:hypothetical protein
LPSGIDYRNEGGVGRQVDPAIQRRMRKLKKLSEKMG